MTKILESLSAFESKSINQLEMGKLMGGKQVGTATGAGSVCTSAAVCSTGCMGFSSDNTCGPSGMAEYYGSNDINQSC